MAILLIAALGVGFFAGLKVTHDVMVHVADTYLGKLNFYDYRLVSTLGFDEGSEEQLLSEEDVKDAEGAKSADVLMIKEDDSELVIKTMSVPEKINLLNLEQGRMPEKADECVVDYHGFDASDIGITLRISESNTEEDGDLFKIKEYTIVGLVSSPLYIRYDRGNTSIGNGVIDAFVYIEEAAYDMDYDTEIYVVFDKGQDGQKRSVSEDTPVIYSDEYDGFMEKKEDTWKTLTQEIAMSRYNRRQRMT
jgi:putative ABC transport system permease protein